MPRCVLRPAILAAALVLGSLAAAGDEPAKPAAQAAAPNVPDDQATAAIAKFRQEFDRSDPVLRPQIVDLLGPVVHPAVADVLLDLALKNPYVPVRTAAFRGLQQQSTSMKELGPKVSKFLAAASEENRKAKARGYYGVRVDPKTGKTDTESEEGKAALRAKRDRSEMLSEAVRLFDVADCTGRDAEEVMREFVNDGNDALATAAIGMFRKWKDWSILPDLLDLYETYPAEDKYVPGQVTVDTGAEGSADAQAAKRAWMAKYGDPDKRRSRPMLVKAIKAAIVGITGETIESPEALREFLRRPDVKRKVKAK